MLLSSPSTFSIRFLPFHFEVTDQNQHNTKRKRNAYHISNCRCHDAVADAAVVVEDVGAHLERDLVQRRRRRRQRVGSFRSSTFGANLNVRFELPFLLKQHLLLTTLSIKVSFVTYFNAS